MKDNEWKCDKCGCVNHSFDMFCTNLCEEE